MMITFMPAQKVVYEPLGINRNISLREGLDLSGGSQVLRALAPLAEMFGYSTTQRSMSQGRATYSMEFKHYAEAPRNVAEAVMNSKK